MKIIIAGAGDIGFHLAQLLAFENQDIVLIDTNTEVLQYVNSHLDVLTLRGDSSSINVLEKAEADKADLLLAVTTSEKNNLVTAILAKKMGTKRTIARVKEQSYLVTEQRNTFRELGIDSLISPRQLAAKEILRLIDQCTFTDIFEFEEGKLSLVGATLDEHSPIVNRKLEEIHDIKFDIALRPIAILRGHQTIIPRGHTLLLRNDHVYFITKQGDTGKLEQFLGMKKIKVKRVMIAGGTGLAYEAAKLLEKKYQVTLFESNKERCKILAENLENTLVIKGKASNIDLLVEEGLNEMDAFIALTPNSETNIIASLTAKNHGVFKTIAQVENTEYVHISQNIGVDSLINIKLIAANNIFRFVRKGKIEAITSLNGVDAEVIEFIVHKNNQLTRKPLKDLHFPESALIGGVVRGEESLLPDGEFQLQVGDKVIVFTMADSISRVEKLFK